MRIMKQARAAIFLTGRRKKTIRLRSCVLVMDSGGWGGREGSPGGFTGEAGEGGVVVVVMGSRR
jgi:hypothetical protein